MIEIESNAQDVPRRMRAFVSRLEQAGLLELDAAAARIQKRMRKSGSPVRYPVQWDSIGQMIAFFASDGFGEGIPYRRKNRYENAWLIRRLPRGVEIGNRSPGAAFIGGTASGRDVTPGKKQSNIHKGRWPLFRPVVDEEIKQIPRDVIERIHLDTPNET